MKRIPWWIKKGVENPAKSLSVRKKLSDLRKGKLFIGRTSFPKGNQYWKLRDQEKNTQLSKEAMNTPEHKLRMSKTMKARWKNEAYRDKMLKYMRGKPSSRKGLSMEQEYGIEKANEIKSKLSKSRKGKKFSDETNKKKGRSGKLNAMSRPEVKEKQLIACRTYGKQWKGGKSYEPYTSDFNQKFKRAIRKRDNYICLKCGKHQEKEKKSLIVHHINYDKSLSIHENCCTLCNKCNSEVNWNRKHWTSFFQSLLTEKYNYQYSSNQQIIQVLQEVRKESW